ncbi:MAG: hypothetical protein RBJ76_23640 [Stenomitos frigidus ULC029]
MNHAEESEAHDKEVEAFGKTSEASIGHVTEVQDKLIDKLIEDAGKDAQRHAIASYNHA